MLSEREKRDLIIEYKNLREKYKRLRADQEYLNVEFVKVQDRKRAIDIEFRKDINEQLLDGEEEDLFW